MIRFDAFNQRERRWLVAGALIGTALLFVLLVARPLGQANDQLRKTLQNRERLWDWVQAAATEAKQIRAAGVGLEAGAPLGERLPALLAEADLPPPQQSTTPEGALALRFERVEFNRLLVLLDRAARAGAQLDALELTALPEPGYVRARLTLTD